jgi:hypothetical protein
VQRSAYEPFCRTAVRSSTSQGGKRPDGRVGYARDAL